MLVGVAVGLLARFVVPPRPASGPVLLILLAIAGALLASFLARAAMLYPDRSPLAYLVAALGGVGAILLYQAFIYARRRG